MKFRYTYQIAPEILQDYCKDSFFKVSILKNSNKQIGGYVLQPAIRDAPIPYLDCDGKPLATFHIFDPTENKEAAMKIINSLTEQFPVKEALICPHKIKK